MHTPSNSVIPIWLTTMEKQGHKDKNGHHSTLFREKEKAAKTCMSIIRYMANRTRGINEQKCNSVFITTWRDIKTS